MKFEGGPNLSDIFVVEKKKYQKGKIEILSKLGGDQSY